MAEAFLRLNVKDRLDALGVAADRLGRPAHLLEYDYLTSGEAIEEEIIVNEYMFTEGGRRFG